MTQWFTKITNVSPNHLNIAGYDLAALIEHSNLLEAAHLLAKGELPTSAQQAVQVSNVYRAALLPMSPVSRFKGEDISSAFAKCLLTDEVLDAELASPKLENTARVSFALGRFLCYLAHLFGNQSSLQSAAGDSSFGQLFYRAATGSVPQQIEHASLLEAMALACVDHGVTPPSAQATRILSSVRAKLQVCLAAGVGAITDVHGGAGRKASLFLQGIAQRAQRDKISIEAACTTTILEFAADGRRVEGLGHRIHTEDPRRDALWQLAAKANVCGPCVTLSKTLADHFQRVTSKKLPINVDGVIGAIVADMGIGVDMAKTLFIVGRVVGLCAHYFEETSVEKPMRQIDFTQATYSGAAQRTYP